MPFNTSQLVPPLRTKGAQGDPGKPNPIILSDGINIQHLSKIIYLSNSIIQLHNIQYRVLVCIYEGFPYNFFQAIENASIAMLTEGYWQVYRIAKECIYGINIITAKDMMLCNRANKMMQMEIEKEYTKKQADAKSMLDARAEWYAYKKW